MTYAFWVIRAGATSAVSLVLTGLLFGLQRKHEQSSLDSWYSCKALGRPDRELYNWRFAYVCGHGLDSINWLDCRAWGHPITPLINLLICCGTGPTWIHESYVSVPLLSILKWPLWICFNHNTQCFVKHLHRSSILTSEGPRHDSREFVLVSSHDKLLME